MELKILHLEDSLSDAELVRYELSKAFPKAEIFHVDTKADFVKSIESNKINLILSDYNVPGFNGMEALNFVKKYYYEIPFIIVSGTIGEENAVEVLKAGAKDYVLKSNLGKLSFSIERAIQEVRDYLKIKIATEELKKNEERISKLFETAIEGIVSVNIKGEITLANKAACQMFGYSKDELIGESLSILIPAGKRVGHKDYVSHFFNNSSPRKMGNEKMEIKGQHKNGETFPVGVALSSFETQHEKVAVAFISNLTEIHEAKNELDKKTNLIEDANERLNIVIKGTNTGLWEWDLITNKVHFNEEWGKQLGYKYDEIDQDFSFWENLVHPDDINEARNRIESYLKGWAKEYSFVHRLKHKNGDWVHILTKGVISKRAEDDTPLYFLGTHTDVNKEEQYLQELDEYGSYFSVSMDIMCIGDSEKYIKINQKFTEVLGYTDEDIIGLNYKDFIHPDDLGKTVDKVELLAKRKEVVNITSRHKCKDGSYKTLMWKAKADERKGLIYSAARDITDLVEEQQKSNQYLELLDNSLNELYVVDAETLKYINVNVGAQKNMGNSLEEFMELSPMDIKIDLSPEDIQTIISPLINKEKEYVTVETRHLRKDGSTYMAYINLQLTQLEGKDVFVGYALDITHRIHQERELIRVKNNLSNIVDYSNVGIAYANKDTSLISANQKFVEILEFENEEEVLGQKIAEYTYPDDLDKDLELIKEIRSGKRDGFEIDKRYVTKTKKIKWVNLSVSAIRNELGDVENFVAMTIDITEKKEAQDNLIKSEKNYRDVFDNVNDAIVVSDENFKIQEYNKAFAKLCEEDMSFYGEIIHHYLDAVIFDDEIKNYRSILDKKGFNEYEGQLRLKNGKIIWGHIRSTAIYDKNNRLKGVREVIRDVTERKEKEEIINVLIQLSSTHGGKDYFNELAISLSQLLNVEHAIIGVYHKDNQQVESIGYSNKGNLEENFIYDLIGTPCKIALDGEIELVESGVQQKYPEDQYLVDMNADSYLGITMFEGKEPIGIIALLDSKPFENIDFITSILLQIKTRTETELTRTKIEHLLVEREARFRGMIENSSEITCLIDEKGVIKYIAPSISKLLNYSVDELMGNKIFDFLHDDDKKKAHDRIKFRYDDGSNGDYDIYRLRTREGEFRYFRAILSNHFQTEGINGFIINAQDISELIYAEDERYRIALQTEENERKRLSQDLHDGLGQTIAAASLYMNTLDSLVGNQLDVETLEIFKKGKELVNKSAKETRMVSHNIMPPSLSQFGLSESLTAMIGNYQKIKEDINISFNTNIEDHRFSHDVELSLYRIIQELINNSLKHSKAENISVSVLINEAKCTISVKDDGVGFNYDCIKENKKAGIGLRNIEQRIEVVDGDFRVNNLTKGVEFLITLKV